MKYHLIALLLIAGFSACKDNNNAAISIRLTDGPGDYDAVVLEIKGVEIHLGQDTSFKAGWQKVPSKPGLYNLLDLTNGLDTLIASDEIPPAKLTQIRLLLGDNNTVMEDSVSHPLDKTGADNQLKLLINQEIIAGGTYDFLLDFDAGRSIVRTGSNKYLLKPVIKAIDASNSGAISGNIDPVRCRSFVVARSGPNIGSSYTNAKTGYFFIQGLPPGIYQLEVDAQSGCPDKIVQSVKVETGATTNLGRLTL